MLLMLILLRLVNHLLGSHIHLITLLLPFLLIRLILDRLPGQLCLRILRFFLLLLLMLEVCALLSVALDRKSTRLNSSHANISYAVFCLKNTAHRAGPRLTG